MTHLGGIVPQQPFLAPGSSYTTSDLPEARSNYQAAIENPMDRHAEVGILSSTGSVLKTRLGKDEEYGTHRVGSVTKTFTTLLAMKLIQDGDLPNGLSTKCGEVLPDEIFDTLFEDPTAARSMTLEQLLSHTSGLECDDHSCNQKEPSKTLLERFLVEGKGGRKYKHTSKPGDGIGTYSNAGYAFAGLMMEVAYNKAHPTSPPLSFSQIMQKELFQGVFQLTETSLEPGPTQDVLQSPAGDVKSSVHDLLKVASRMQQENLDPVFGSGWVSTMLQPRDLLQHHGLGCEANAPSIEHKGLNREMFGSENRDISALTIFPIKPGTPGLVAMCDSSALGPKPQEQRFIESLKKSAGISFEVQKEPTYELGFFCPSEPNVILFHGTAYLACDVDPFTRPPPSSITCSRNGMKHVLTRDTSLDKNEITGYHDENGKPWLVINRSDGRKAIYSDYCLVTNKVEVGNLLATQPSAIVVKSLEGVYQNAENSDEHPTYTFTEDKGRLYMIEGNDKDRFPCLYIPDTQGGKWVVSNPSGREIQFRFPNDPDNKFLLITDILNDIPQLPNKSRRIH